MAPIISPEVSRSFAGLGHCTAGSRWHELAGLVQDANISCILLRTACFTDKVRVCVIEEGPRHVPLVAKFRELSLKVVMVLLSAAMIALESVHCRHSLAASVVW